MRRKDRALSLDEAQKILEQGEYGILSMCTTDQSGYGIPLNYVLVGDALYFHGALEGSKLTYLKANPKASFCVVGKTTLQPEQFGTLYESAIASGVASLVEGGEKRRALDGFIEKYSSDYPTEGQAYIERFLAHVSVLKLQIHEVTGKAKRG